MSVSVNKTYSAADLKFLNLLSEKFPTIADATTEIINLEAILNLPKGTEHFLTDLHGEYEAFRHVLKNASGVIRQKVHEVFNNTLRESEMTELCTLIYYPAEKLQLIKQKESNLDDWYKVTLNQLTEVCRAVSVKYTSSWQYAVMCRANTPARRCARCCLRIFPMSFRSFSTNPIRRDRPNRVISTGFLIRSSRSDGRMLSLSP